jgi:hypothetical protein
MAMMPFRLPSRSVWKKLRNARPGALIGLIGNGSPPKLRLLGQPSVVEILVVGQGRVQEVAVHTCSIPQTIEIAGIPLRGHEAAVDVGGSATGDPQYVEGSPEAGEQVPATPRATESRGKLFPRRRVDARRQVPVAIEGRNHAGTIPTRT